MPRNVRPQGPENPGTCLQSALRSRQDPQDLQDLQDLLARRIARRLDEAAQHISHPVGERIKAARNRAIAHRKVCPHQVAVQAIHGFASEGAAIFYPGDPSKRPGFGFEKSMQALLSVISLIVLVVGMFFVAEAAEENVIAEKAVVDMQLLLDVLSPADYLDDGFLQFLKQSKD